MKKVLMVAPYFYPRRGGLENYVLNLAKTLIGHHGVDVSVVCSNWERGGPAGEAISGIRVFRLPYCCKVSTTPVHPSWGRSIDAVIAETRPDVINGHLPVPFIADIAARAAMRRGVPFVLTLHDVMAQSSLYGVLSGIYFSLLGNRTLVLSRRIIANSPQTARNFHPSLTGAHKDRVSVVAPGVDPSLFRPQEPPAPVSGGKVILFVGQLYPSSRKGLDVLIRSLPAVAEKVPYAKLVVIGPGPTEPYRKIAVSLGIHDRVEFLGPMDPSALPGHYNRADVFVLPSCKRSEGFGMSLIEAQACRRPVIGTRVGGIEYAVLDGKTGLLVPPGDPVELARAIVRILRDGDLARTLAENGFRRVREEFTWERCAAKTVEIYREAADGSPVRPAPAD